MTPSHLWLDGDPTDGRTIPVPEPAAAQPPADPPPRGPRDPDPPGPPPGRRSGLVPAIAGGLVAAVLVGAGFLGYDALDGSGRDASSTTPVVAATPGARGNDVGSIYAAASAGVVSIRTGSGSGTGFVVAGDGTIVTNAHVVGDSSTVQVQFKGKDDPVRGNVVGVDRSSDLAVVRVDPGGVGTLHPLELADSDTVGVGQLAVAIGSPFGLDQTATAGIVSGVGREIRAPDGFQIDKVIQTDAPINPGNSGGPLLDSRARVIGVNSQIQTGGSGNGNVGIGFAIPANTVKDVLPKLERGQTIARPFLGVSTAPSTGAGAAVASVTPGSPAAGAGIRAGDLIVRVGSTAVEGPDDVSNAVVAGKPGDRVTVVLERDGVRRSIDVTLGTRPERTP